jgi:TPR repeat protein
MKREALYFLSIFLVNQVLIGSMGSKWLQSSLQELETAANQGDAYAQAYLGLCYMHGEKELDISLLEARYHAENSARQAHWLGDFVLGYLSRQPPLGPDPQKVSSHYLRVFRDPDGRVIKQAALGDPIAAFTLAEILTSEEVKSYLEPDLKMASSYYELAAYEGYAPAAVQYGLMILHNVVAAGDTELNQAKGIRLLQDAVDDKLPSAHHYLGRCYLEGTGVDVDKTLAFIQFQAAADRGYGMSQLILANFYAQGVTGPPDFKQAIHYAQLAVEQKTTGADEALKKINAMVDDASSDDLGEFPPELSLEESIPQNSFEDLPEPKQVTFDPGDPSRVETPSKSFRIPSPYGQTRNTGTQQPDEAILANTVAPPIPPSPLVSVPSADLPVKAKDLCEQGKRAYWGQRQQVDFIEAARLFERAAELGNAEAARYLGIIYLRGKGTAKDLVKAMKWFEESAAGGDALAKKNLFSLKSVIEPN